MLKTRFGRWTLLLILLIGGGYVVTHGGDGFNVPFTNGQSDRPHKVNNQRDHDGGSLRLLVTWRGFKPDLIIIGVEGQPERLAGDQVPSQPPHVLRTYTYHPGLRYVIDAEQDNPIFEGPLDCEITLDGQHVDGDRLSHGHGGVECYILPA